VAVVLVGAVLLWNRQIPENGQDALEVGRFRDGHSFKVCWLANDDDSAVTPSGETGCFKQATAQSVVSVAVVYKRFGGLSGHFE